MLKHVKRNDRIESPVLIGQGFALGGQEIRSQALFVGEQTRGLCEHVFGLESMNAGNLITLSPSRGGTSHATTKIEDDFISEVGFERSAERMVEGSILNLIIVAPL